MTCHDNIELIYVLVTSLGMGAASSAALIAWHYGWPSGGEK